MIHCKLKRERKNCVTYCLKVLLCALKVDQKTIKKLLLVMSYHWLKILQTTPNFFTLISWESSCCVSIGWTNEGINLMGKSFCHNGFPGQYLFSIIKLWTTQISTTNLMFWRGNHVTPKFSNVQLTSYRFTKKYGTFQPPKINI